MIYFITCSLIWGLTWIAIKYQLNAVDHSVAVFYRFALASVLLFSIAFFKRQKLAFDRQAHLRFIGQGFFMFCLNYLLTYWASEMAPSALVALAFTSLIYFNMFGARLLFKTPFNSQVIYGALVSLAGMAFISFNELQSQALHPSYFIGFFISLIATLSASAGNLISSMHRKSHVSIISNNSWSMLYGAAMCLLFCLYNGKSFAVSFSTDFVLSFVYLTIFGTIISFGAYLKLIDLVGPTKAAFTSVISPVIAVVMSHFFEHLSLNIYLVLGVLLCICGNLVALTPRHIFLKLKNAL